MGLFDSFWMGDKCPTCGKDIAGWQTKSLWNSLLNWNKGDKIDLIVEDKVPVHQYCTKCDTWMEGHIIIENGIVKDVVVDKVEKR